MSKFRQIFTELSAQDMPIFSFQDDNLSKKEGILTKLAICIDIKKIWFGILMGKFHLIFTELSARVTPIISFPDDNFSK